MTQESIIYRTRHDRDGASIELTNGRRIMVDREGTLSIHFAPGEGGEPMLIDVAGDKIRPL